MEAYDGAKKESIDITKKDVQYMSLVDSAFDSSPHLRNGLPSVRQDIKDLISDIIVGDASVPNLFELFEMHGKKKDQNIMTMLASMLVAAVKQSRNTLGKKALVYLEEVELMLSDDSKGPLKVVEKCLGKH